MKKRKYHVLLVSNQPNFAGVDVEATSQKAAEQQALQTNMWELDWQPGDKGDMEVVHSEEVKPPKEVPHG